MTTMINPWQHQINAITFATAKRGAGIFAGVGLGKTRIAIELLRQWEARRVLIVGPKAGLDVWVDQLPKWQSQLAPIATPANLPIIRRWDYAISRIRQFNGKPFALILNYEALWREPFHNWLLNNIWDCIVCDEAHKLKSPGGKQSKFLATLGKNAKRRLGLTGTPMAQSPLDAYALYRFLDNRVFGTSFAVFKSRYAVMDPMFPSRAVGFINMGDFKQRFDSIGYSVTADQAGVWLPDHVDVERTCDLDDESRRIYDELTEEFCAGVRDGTVTPDSAAVRLLRLQQITSGHIRTDNADLIRLDAAKADLLRAVLDEIAPDEPIVVFARFRPDLDLIHRVAESLGRTSAELSGERNELAEWQDSGLERIHTKYSEMEVREDRARTDGSTEELVSGDIRRRTASGAPREPLYKHPAILAVQIQAGSAAVDLSRARYAIYYSVGFSLLDYEQSRGRIKRPNSAHHVVFYVHLIARNTVDRKVYRALKARKQVIDSIMAGVKEGEGLGDEIGD